MRRIGITSMNGLTTAPSAKSRPRQNPVQVVCHQLPAARARANGVVRQRPTRSPTGLLALRLSIDDCVGCSRCRDAGDDDAMTRPRHTDRRNVRLSVCRRVMNVSITSQQRCACGMSATFERGHIERRFRPQMEGKIESARSFHGGQERRFWRSPDNIGGLRQVAICMRSRSAVG